MSDDYVPDRGDVVWILYTPPVGAERVGRRKAVVLSPAAYNRRVGLALFCPIVSRVKGYPFEVRVPDEACVGGVVLADQVKTLQWQSRATEYICRLPESTMNEVLQKLGLLLT